MALQPTDDAFEQAKNPQTTKTDNKTEIDKHSVIEALSDLENGKAYSTVELYNFIVHGDSNSDNEPDSDDLRAFVPIYNAITDDDGRLADKYRKQIDCDDDLVFTRRRVGDSGYKNWYFGLVPKGAL